VTTPKRPESATRGRRQRDRQDREDRILDLAERALATKGYLGLNLDKLAQQIEWSKGTLYLHFACKEDLILAVAARSMARRAHLFERAGSYEGRARERLTAVAVADAALKKLHPAHFQIEALVRAPSLWDKTSSGRRKQLAEPERRCLDVIAGIVRDAIEQGDLVRPPISAPAIAFSFWALAYGTNLLAQTMSWNGMTWVSKDGFVVDPGPSQNAYMDGLGWRPFASEWDYAKTARKVAKQLFAAELE
jgi:AcrR family transcriptional regulator